MAWSELKDAQQEGKQEPIQVRECLDQTPARFCLFQSDKILTLWTLYDNQTRTQHFLYGEDWAEAQEKADKRMVRVLEKGA